MSNAEANLMGKWLAQGSGWGQTHSFKSRKKETENNIRNKEARQRKQQSQQQQQQQQQQQRTFHQLDLSGENIDLQDGEAFGDTMTKKGPGILRFISQNWNGIPESSYNDKSSQIVNQICSRDADGWMGQETGLCWYKVEEKNQWRERTRQKGIRLNSNFQFNTTELERTEAIQAGGVAVIITNDLTPRCCERGGDPTGLGRWAWTRIEGTDN
jgi:hypothetical protein